jgi:hypothetical protein
MRSPERYLRSGRSLRLLGQSAHTAAMPRAFSIRHPHRYGRTGTEPRSFCWDSVRSSLSTAGIRGVCTVSMATTSHGLRERRSQARRARGTDVGRVAVR